MLDSHRVPVVRWVVDYGDGSRPAEVLVPHSWRQDLPVAAEGPVTYSVILEVPRGDYHLLFHRVSYAAEISIEGEWVATHHGLWDSFSIPLERFGGRTVRIDVRVTKNGGPSFPVRKTLSGFLPYVFHTFGGIYGTVELVKGKPTLDAPAPASRVEVRGTRIYVDDKPFFMRGLLHWGWFPDYGHPNPPEEIIRTEVREAKALGFNTVKFCLWVPPHRYLAILREEGMFGWLELPLWAPDPELDPTDEITEIVRQYRHHDNVIVWTVGCELGASVDAERRELLTRTVRSLTGCPLVRDDSGGAEMYGGDPREFGTFYDFHPYCELPHYPAVLDSLLPGARATKPVLLGEFNDFDVHRDLARMGDELPYWASNLAELNDQGVRWQYDLPRVLDASRFSTQPTRSGHNALMESSRRLGLFVRKTVHEGVHARGGIAGVVTTGWRDTPVSSSGMFDDWGTPRFTPEECAPWNSDTVLFLIPARRPRWKNGGNRVGYRDPLNIAPGPAHWRVGVRTMGSWTGGLLWRIVREEDGKVMARGVTVRGDSPQPNLSEATPMEVAEIFWPNAVPGSYTLMVESGDGRNAWPIWVRTPDPADVRQEWSLFDPDGWVDELELGSGPWRISTRPGQEAPTQGIALMVGEGTRTAPFWREATYEFLNHPFWVRYPLAERWSRLMPLTTDRVIDTAWLREHVGEYEVLLNRIDTRTYEEAPVLARAGKVLLAAMNPMFLSSGILGAWPEAVAEAGW